MQHLDKYWDYLFGHVLKIRPEKIVVPRTNNVEESLSSYHVFGGIAVDDGLTIELAADWVPPAIASLSSLHATSLCGSEHRART